MYEETFNFSQRPFSVCPQPEDFFPGQSHQLAISASRVCIERRNGPATIIGAVGTGKSLTLQVIGEAFSPQLDVVSIECSRLEQRSELLQSILFGLNLPFRDLGEGELRLSLIDHLKNGNGNPNGALLLVDEADCLSIELLDELRLITNVTRNGHSQVQLVLSGTQRLEESLNDPRLASFSQRIASRNYLQNFSRDEVSAYISQQIEAVGRSAQEVFEEEAINEVARSSDGCPRLINQLCERSLAVTASQQQGRVTQDIVKCAWAELQNLPIPNCSAHPANSKADCLNEGSLESVVEFGSLDEDVSESYTSNSADQVDVAVVQQETPEAKTTHPQTFQAGGLDETFVDASVLGNDGAEVHNKSDADGGGVTDSESQTDVVQGWSGQLPANMRVTDYPAYGAGLAGFAATTYGSGGDPFAPEEEQPTTQPTTQPFQYRSENALASETTADTSFGQFDSHDTHNVSETVSSGGVDDQGKLNASVDVGTAEVTAENDVQSAFDGLEQIDQARSAQTANVLEQQPVASAVDPFDEDFEEEVLLQDTYSPFVAQQNKSSLSVTSEHLSHLQPNDEVGIAVNAIDQGAVGEEETASDSTSGFETPPAESDRTYVPVQSVTTELAFPELSQTPQSHGPVEEIDPELAALTSDFSFEDETSFHATTETGTQMQYGDPSQTVDAGQERYSVTGGHFPSDTEDPNVEPPNSKSEEFVGFSSEGDSQAMAGDDNGAIQYPQQPPLDQSQQVLREILAQQQIVNESQFNLPQPNEQDVDSISVEYPITEHNNYQAPSGSVSDDRDMLRVNESHYSQTPQVQSQEPSPYAESQPSTGEAKRLDYSQLFDQLRNMPKQ